MTALTIPPDAGTAAGHRPEPIVAVPVRRYGQWISAAVVLVVAAGLVASLVANENIDYSIIGDYLTAETVLHGLLLTFELTAIGMAIGIVVGVLVAMARMSSNRVLIAMASFYIWFFRGVPLLVQLVIWGNFALLFPTLGVGIPFTDVMFLEVDTNVVLTTFVAACLGLGLNEGAYMAEVVRGGVVGVDRGQAEAATALGMGRGTAMRRIILPQAFRMIIPPTGNQLITLLKSSSLVSVIAGGELMTSVMDVASVNFRTIEMLVVASFWYLVIVSVLTIGQRMLERRASRGHAH